MTRGAQPLERSERRALEPDSCSELIESDPQFPLMQPCSTIITGTGLANGTLPGFRGYGARPTAEPEPASRPRPRDRPCGRPPEYRGARVRLGSSPPPAVPSGSSTTTRATSRPAATRRRRNARGPCRGDEQRDERPAADPILRLRASATFALVPTKANEEPPPFDEEAASLAFEYWRRRLESRCRTSRGHHRVTS